MPEALTYLQWMRANVQTLQSNDAAQMAGLNDIQSSNEMLLALLVANVFKEHANYAACDANIGVTNVTASMVANIPADLQAILDYDAGVLFNRTFFPNITGNFPETTGPNAIGMTAPYFSGNKFDPNVYAKERSISHTLGYPPRLSLFTTNQTNERLTLFLQNIENRGFDDSPIKHHLLKRQYMAALDPSTIMNRYDDLIHRFIESVYHSSVVSKQPFLSAVDDALMEFFLNVHLGVDNHPKFVKDWFYNFSAVTADLNPNKLYTPTPAQMKVKTTRLIYMYHNAECVRSYFEERINIIERDGDTCTLIKHWMAAGMSKEKTLTEAMHNIVAYRQFINMFRLIVQQSLHPQINTGGMTYFAIYASAMTEVMRTNIVREMFRLEIPNGASFSSLKNPPGGIHHQVLHLHKLIEIQAEGSPAAWAAFNTGRYTSPTFDADYTAFVDSPGDREARCPFGFSDSNVGKRNIVRDFKLSPVDNSTVVWNAYENFIPVFPNGKFGPFGYGDRRCPGEAKAVRTTMVFMKVFKCVVFYENTTMVNPKMIPVAPYTWVPDNYFVNITGVSLAPGCN